MLKSRPKLMVKIAKTHNAYQSIYLHTTQSSMMTFTDVQDQQLYASQEFYIDQPISISIWKRLFDLLVASLVTLAFLTWMIPLIGLWIKLTSPGPFMFVQWRTGRNGQPFRCLKFRTMIYHQNDVQFKQTHFNDPRVTPLGRWLRKTNLDEMPQFLNVIMGHMSVVGPRPHALEHDAKFWFSLPQYHQRYTTLPGITGLAQVRGNRGFADDVKKMEERLVYDLIYIKNSSLQQDAQICWWTLKLMFRGDPKAW